jgi:hypothetical protein
LTLWLICVCVYFIFDIYLIYIYIIDLRTEIIFGGTVYAISFIFNLLSLFYLYQMLEVKYKSSRLLSVDC